MQKFCHFALKIIDKWPKDYKWILAKIRHLNPFGESLFMKNGERIRSYDIHKVSTPNLGN